MMKKAAIITFFQTQDNYGQILQCFALQKTLRTFGVYPFVIRYGFHQGYFHWFNWKNYFTRQGVSNSLWSLKRYYITKFKRNQPDRKFESFRRHNLQFSLYKYNTLTELQANPPKADIYITGSDQVWAQLLDNRNNRSFFLDFGCKQTKRIAYAPSFAVKSYPEELQSDLKELLLKFDAISVREESGVTICHGLGLKAQQVADPTLLLPAQEYGAIPRPPHPGKYCFVYHVNITTPEEMHWDIWQEYNRRKALPTFATFANPQAGLNMEILAGADYVYPTIPQWIGWIKNAEYVITSSFHGTVFAILFHVPFVVCLREESMFAGNDRVITLLRTLHLESRIMHSNSPDNILSQEINWEEVDAKLFKLRNASLSFLRNAIS